MKAKQREWQPLAPKLLNPLLQYYLPAEIVEKSKGRYRVLADLDSAAEKLLSPTEVALIKEMVKAAVAQDIRSMPKELRESKLGPLPATLDLRSLGLTVRTLNCLKSAGYLDDPVLLSAATVQEVVNLPSFGAVSLIDLVGALESWQSSPASSEPPPEVTSPRNIEKCKARAKKLAALKDSKRVRLLDSRLGPLMRRVAGRLVVIPERPSAYDLAQRALSYADECLDPAELAEALGDLTREIRRLGRISLEDELGSFLRVRSARERKIICRRLGWDGGGVHTLEDAGIPFGVTRQGVQLMERRALAPLRRPGIEPYAPATDRALRLVSGSLPSRASDLSKKLACKGISKAPFELSGLLRAATHLRRKPRFVVKPLGSAAVAVPKDWPDFASEIRRAARKAVVHWGVSTSEDLRASVQGSTWESIPIWLVEETVSQLNGFEWLEREGGWFWISTTSRNRLRNQIRKIMSVASRLHVSELRAGVSRPYPMRGYSPPRRVLLELCRRLPDLRVVGETIERRPREATHRTALSGAERTLARILAEDGPLLLTADFEELALAAGVNQSSFYSKLAYSPVISRYASTVYGLRGVEFPPGLAESMAPKGTRNRILQDHGWTSDGRVWIGYRLTRSVVATGIITIPSSLKKMLHGVYDLRSEDGADMGVFKLRDTSGWGLRALFTRRGVEPEDTLVLMFNLETRTVMARLGGEELIENLEVEDTSG